MTALIGVKTGGEEFDVGEENRDEEVDEEPTGGEDSRAERDDEIRDDEGGGQDESEGGDRDCAARVQRSPANPKAKTGMRSRTSAMTAGRMGKGADTGSIVLYRKPRWGVGRESDRKIGG